jgi:hypothetical protein
MQQDTPAQEVGSILDTSLILRYLFTISAQMMDQIRFLHYGRQSGPQGSLHNLLNRHLAPSVILMLNLLQNQMRSRIHLPEDKYMFCRKVNTQIRVFDLPSEKGLILPLPHPQRTQMS